MVDRPLDDMYRRPGFLLKRCHQVAMALFIEECREFGLTPQQFGTLRALCEYPGIDQVALGRLLGTDRTTVALVTRLLSERGAIRRTPNPRDKRRVSLILTAEGERLLEAATPAAARAQEKVLASLPAAMRAPFVGMLETFLEGHGALIDVDKIVGAALVEK